MSRDEMTTGEAAAWRAGVDAAAVELRAMAARMRGYDPMRLAWRAATLETAAAALAEMEPSP